MQSKVKSAVEAYFKPGVQRRRLIMTIVGVCVTGIAAGMLKQAAFGVDPYQCMCNGLHQVIPMSFGTLYMLINLATLVVVYFLNRHYIGIATLINMFLLGYIIDGTEQLLMSFIPAPSIGVRVFYLLAGIVIVCFAASLYFTADLGVSTYDAVAIIMANTWKWGQFKFVRIATDVCCVVLGCGLFLLGGGRMAQIPAIAGVGTILTAFFMGPLIDFFNRKFSVPFLEKSKK